MKLVILGVLVTLSLSVNRAAAQIPSAPGAASAPTLAPDYRIGPEDVLSVVFWRDTDLSAEVMVRPDGKISLPLLNDVQAAGLTPEELRGHLMRAASKFIEDPNASVVVKTVNSRKVFITGMISRPAAYPLVGSMNVLQLIALAGGLAEYAGKDKIQIVRVTDGKTDYFKFNYNDVMRQKNVQQNIDLRPGDTVVVP
jgi:polysaccharide export outer membrane protein